MNTLSLETIFWFRNPPAELSDVLSSCLCPHKSTYIEQNPRVVNAPKQGKQESFRDESFLQNAYVHFIVLMRIVHIFTKCIHINIVLS